jgi:hypothetical protein
MKTVCVELHNGKVVRIFRTAKAAAVFMANLVLHSDSMAVVTNMDKLSATRAIRRQLFESQNKLCAWCGAELTWEGCQMHEKIPRGHGGEISLANSIILCYECHFKDRHAHGNRKLHFKKSIPGQSNMV